MIRLLELRNTYKWGGGPDKTILLSAERHDPKRVAVVVAYLRPQNDHEFRIGERARAQRLTYYEIPERGKLDLRVVRVVREIVRQRRIDIIHAHDFRSDLVAYLVGLSLGRRRPILMSTAHAWVMAGRKGDVYRHLDLLLMRRFDQLIAVSNATKAQMVAGGVRAERIAVVHNGIDTEAWSREHADGGLAAEWKLPRGGPVIGYVGRIMPEKNLETWLRVAASVASSVQQARFVLVGDGRDGRTERELKALARGLGIEASTTFAGYRSDLLSVYTTFDVFMMTSRREGLPNSILEAMALGLPVVTTDVAGAKELVDHGVTGFVRPQDDASGLAAAATALAGDPALRRRMGAAGRLRVEKEFSFTDRLARIEDLYEQVVGKRAVPDIPRRAVQRSLGPQARQDVQ